MTIQLIRAILNGCWLKCPIQATVQLCHSGNEALQRAQSFKPDIIIMDYYLGSRNGIEVIHDLQNSLLNTAYILLTGHDGEKTAVAAIRAGVLDYLSKEDLSATQLEKSLHHALQRLNVEKKLRQAHTELKKSHENLEECVLKRTRELDASNNQLKMEIAHRQRVENALRQVRNELGENVLERTVELDAALGTIKTQIDDRIRAEEKLSLYAKVVQNTSEAIIITDAETRIIEVNDAYCQVTGYSRKEVIGNKPTLVQSKHHDNEFYEEMWESIHQTGCWKGEVWDRRKNGDLFPTWLTINRMKDMDNNIANFVGIFSDITKMKNAEERLERLAYYDPLTGLPNRMLFRDRLEHEFSVVQRSGKKVGVFFIDLDRFKEVNDSLGHSAGDELLKEISRRLKSRLRSVDTVARMGGDEFTVILASLETTHHVSTIAKEIIDELAKAVRLGEQEVYTGGSIGIAIYPDDGKDFETITRNADSAMYEAKKNGRGTFRFYTQELNAKSTRRLSLEARLHRAVERQELLLQYQPQVDLKTDRIIGAEALVRWQHPELGLIHPKEFIPLAEETGLTVPLCQWILRTACQQAIQWNREGFQKLRMAVNLSARQFLKRDLGITTEKVLNDVGFDPKLLALELEITESMIMEDVDSAIDTLKRLRAMGLRIAMDDFGTGYSSLSYLQKFPIGVLKIDQSFVGKMDPGSGDDAAIVTAIISLARSLSMEVIAEGVETADQLHFLKTLNCDYYQGYYFSPPLSAEAFHQLLLKNHQTEKNQPMHLWHEAHNHPAIPHISKGRSWSVGI